MPQWRNGDLEYGAVLTPPAEILKVKKKHADQNLFIFLIYIHTYIHFDRVPEGTYGSKMQGASLAVRE